MRNWIIVGDTEKYGECLVYVCGTEEHANLSLKRMLEHPTERDKTILQDHKNLRTKFVPDDACWWDDPFYMAD